MNNIDPLHPPKLFQAKRSLHIGQSRPSRLALALVNQLSQQDGVICIITPDIHSAWVLQANLKFFSNPKSHFPIHVFRDWETLPYDHFSPSADIISERIQVLATLPRLQTGFLIVPISTLMQRIAPKDYMLKQSFSIAVGKTFALSDVRLQLQQVGYRLVDQVMAHGEFAIRGSLFDIFPMGSTLPYRIDLFDEEIDSIRSFDPDNQRSLEKIDTLDLFPAHEYPLDEAGISYFRGQFRSRFPGNPATCPIYEAISHGSPPAGIEYYLPLFFEKTHNLLDYLPTLAHLVLMQDCQSAGEQYWIETKNRFEQRQHDITRPILSPHEILTPPSELFATCKQYPRIKTFKPSLTETTAYNFQCENIQALLIEHKASNPYAKLQAYLDKTTDRVLFCVDSPGRREALLDLLKKINIVPVPYDTWQSFCSDDAQLGICIAPYLQGFRLPTHHISLLTEAQLFGKVRIANRRRQAKTISEGTLIRNVMELNEGSPIVHIDHGVGRYLGLQNMQIGEHPGEFLVIEYAGNDKVYVPVTALHLVCRYSGNDPEHAPINRLGSDQWKKAKKKAAAKIRDVAAELLALYAKREASQGIAFKIEDDSEQLFAASFPYEPTPDQYKAMQSVKHDMQQTRPMDRLICGDVGFGKTEIAIRAAFTALMNHKQVAVFVPTTLLAEQHYDNFRDRFADWPVHIEVLSRFKSNKEQADIIERLCQGKIDIIIGTHKLLNKSIRFKSLGLLIIDEEHRFGVTHKEKIKKLRENIDILTLTATPIPRTLNMAFSGIRDFSIIATPPTRRLPVKTFIHEKEPGLVKEAILREIARGGQVFYVHNKVQTIEREAHQLKQWVPEINIQFAHGQLPERDLENIMTDFHHQRFNVLVCTTIIESGIDIPTANTIIINRADHFGLAQLHQMRGRVGRSHHQAYAYLLTPEKSAMTSDAKKRLEAIASFEELGAGFSLATQDMEIRGAGELLGEAQSGQMQTIGLSLYLDMLERAVKALKQGDEPNFDKQNEASAEINLAIPALIPDTFIHDVQVRLTLYKRIAFATHADELDEFQVEMIDRFGLLPEATKNLFNVTHIKLRANKMGVIKIDATSKGGSIVFNDKPNIDPMRIITMVQNRPGQYKLAGANKLIFTFSSETDDERITLIHTILDTLQNEKK